MSNTSTTGGEWSKKASTMKAAKLGNACPKASFDGEKIDWASISNTERPLGRLR